MIRRRKQGVEQSRPIAAGCAARSSRRRRRHELYDDATSGGISELSRQYLEGARYRGDGSGPAYIKLERAVRYRRSVLDAWMSAHDHSPDKPSLAE